MTGTDGKIASLYEQVFARPEDDELRHVLADALLAVGDPRGELITVQLHPTSDHSRRAMRLIQQFGLAWTGALRGAVIPLAYERGFLAIAQALPEAARLRGAREWATVHTLELAAPMELAFLADPVMRSLRRLEGVSTAWLGEVVALPQLQTIVTLGGDTIARGADGRWAFPAELADDDGPTFRGGSLVGGGDPRYDEDRYDAVDE